MLMKGRIIILNNKEQIYIKQEKLHIYEYQNAIILPRKYEDDGPTWGKGGVCSQEGELFKVHFTMVDGLRMVENMSGIRQMRFI